MCASPNAIEIERLGANLVCKQTKSDRLDAWSARITKPACLGVVRVVRINRRSVQRQEAYELQISGVDSPREKHEDRFALIEDDEEEKNKC